MVENRYFGPRRAPQRGTTSSGGPGGSTDLRQWVPRVRTRERSAETAAGRSVFMPSPPAKYGPCREAVPGEPAAGCSEEVNRSAPLVPPHPYGWGERQDSHCIDPLSPRRLSATAAKTTQNSCFRPDAEGRQHPNRSLPLHPRHSPGRPGGGGSHWSDRLGAWRTTAIPLLGQKRQVTRAHPEGDTEVPTFSLGGAVLPARRGAPPRRQPG